MRLIFLIMDYVSFVYVVWEIYLFIVYLFVVCLFVYLFCLDLRVCLFVCVVWLFGLFRLLIQYLNF